MSTIKRLRLLFALFIFVSVFCFTHQTFASTIIGTDITENTTWTKTNSPYIIENNIVVLSGVTLTIEPGVVVKVKPDFSFFGVSVSVFGKLVADGTAAEPIYFTSNYDDEVGGNTDDETFCYEEFDEEGNVIGEICETYDFGDPLAGDWGGIYFRNSIDSNLENVSFRYADSTLSLRSSNANFKNVNINDSYDGIYFYLGNIVLDNVSFKNIDGDAIGVYDGVIEIKNSTIEAVTNGDAIGFYGGSLHVSGLTVKNIGFGSAFGIYRGNAVVENSIFEKGLDAGIELYGGSLDLHDSRISSYPSGNLAFYRGVATLGRLKIENTNYGVAIYGGAVTLSESAFKGIVVNAIENYSGSSIDARENFWGDVSGPYEADLNPLGLGYAIYGGDVLFTPWLTSDPFNKPTCCSSVLFLPGIKGSVLKKGSDTLWPPTFFSFNDVLQLALTGDGESVNSVNVDGILNTFHGTDIYASFSNFMNDLVSEELINEWLPLGYDWRFSPEQIIEDGIKTSNGTIDIIEKFDQLAANSKNGKVTIVAHSMGGLLGKAIIKKLQEEGKDDLIESFVMVATPQLGTPQAVASILHGDSEGIIPGVLVHPADMRTIAQNMPSAYNLLPSSRYFTEVLDPVIKFNSESPFTQAWRDFWGASINVYSNFLSFVTGTGVTRTKPVENILRNPEVLKGDFMADAIIFHREYDDYQLPEHVRVIQVAGWGSPTTKAVEYKNSHGIPSYETIPTVEGDRAVVYSSAVSSVADETYFFDLAVYNALENVNNIQHRDLLNASPVQDFIKNIIEKENVLENSYLKTTKPDPGNTQDQLIVSTHSPVILGAYDQSGNFTGVDPNQDLFAEILSIKEDIPGSAFLYTSESQYIFLPKEGIYNFIYKGVGEGLTTVKIDNFSSDVVTPVVQYSNIPTTGVTKAEFTVTSSAPEATVLEVDIDSDGDVDETVYEDNYEFSLSELIAQIKSKIQSLNAKDKLKQNLIKKIENLEKKIQKKKELNMKILKNFEKKIAKEEMRGKINTADATEITRLLDILEAQSDNIALDSGTLLELKAKINLLTIKQVTKKDLLKRVERLENKQALIRSLSNLSKDITKKASKGRIVDTEAQGLIDIISKVENVI